jgi:transcriptional regulator with XRE-family HTH domain
MRSQAGVVIEIESYTRRMPGVATVQEPRVGELLRSWRRRRNLSQLELSNASEVSTRHLSFVETGRAVPSRDMVVRLAEQLDVPMRERNALLLAAGYAPLYRERPLDDEAMAPVRAALDHFLRAHEPFPALVVDDHWNIVTANDALGLLTEGVAPELLEPTPNVLRVALHPRGMAQRTVNLAEWSAHILNRLRRRAANGGDPALEDLYAELKGYPGVAHEPPHTETLASEIAVPLRLRHLEGEFQFLSTISTFGTANDITLANLSVEAFYPANAQTASVLLKSL